MGRFLFMLLIGLPGLAVLLWLGNWQMDRLEWKRGVLDKIELRLAAEEVALPTAPTPEADEYLPVTLTGAPTDDVIYVLSSGTKAGTGYRVISAWDVDGRRIMVDMGVVSLVDGQIPPAKNAQTITGNVFWPDDAADASPAPDLAKNLWFARDAATMAEALAAEPFMVALRSSDMPDPVILPVPVDTSGIKNDHLEYAITWFLLAFVWAVMCGYFVFRTSRDSRKD